MEQQSLEKIKERILELNKELIKNRYKQEKDEKKEQTLIQELKKVINSLENNHMHHRLQNIYQDGKINIEALDYCLNLYKNKTEVKEDIEDIKRKQKKEKEKKDLKIILENIKKYSEQQINKLEKISHLKPIKRPKQKLLNAIYTKIINRKQEKIISQELEELYQIIQKSKTEHENKELKEKYIEKTNLVLTLEQIEIICETKELTRLIELKNKLKEEYKIIRRKINKDLIKDEEQEEKQYDKQIYEYVYNKQNNDITYIIEQSNENSFFITLLQIIKSIYEIENENQENKTRKQTNN